MRLDLTQTDRSSAVHAHRCQIGGRALRQVGHSILTSIQRDRQRGWKKWPQGVTMRDASASTSNGFMQITHSVPASPVSMSRGPACKRRREVSLLISCSSYVGGMAKYGALDVSCFLAVLLDTCMPVSS